MRNNNNSVFIAIFCIIALQFYHNHIVDETLKELTDRANIYAQIITEHAQRIEGCESFLETVSESFLLDEGETY